MTDFTKLLRVDIDNKLKFDIHVKTLCYKVNEKMSALSRPSTHISRDQALSICSTVILSYFN